MNEFKQGECGWCGATGTIYCDNDRCEDCDSAVYHCAICKQDYDQDHGLCRHLFQTRWSEWDGSGTDCDPGDSTKKSFIELIGLMPSDFAADLRTAIRSGKFYTLLIAPMIGGGGLLELHGIPHRLGGHSLFEYGDRMIEIGESDAAEEETADGYYWLASLFETQTPKANQTTIAWLDAWIEQQFEDIAALGRLADDGCPHHHDPRT